MPVSGRLLTPLERKIAFTGAGDALRLRTESALLPRLKGKGITFHTLKIYRCVLKIPADTGPDIVIKML
jgi:hypothetical protein